jgi:hypothetical protein
LLTRKAHIQAFWWDLQVPFDNHLAGRDVRMVNVPHKVSGTFCRTQGAAAFGRIRGSPSTLRTQGLSLRAALLPTFAGQPTLPAFSCSDQLHFERYLVERGFGRVKGTSLSLSPMDVQRDQRTTGLIPVLSLALRLLTLLEWRCRQRLAEQREGLAGWSAGNPKRTTSRRTAEAVWQAFRLIHVSVVTLGSQLHRQRTPLSETQQRIFALLGPSPTLSERLAAQSLKPT